MPQPLISVLTKTPLPAAPLGYEGTTPIVRGNASVPIELRITGAVQESPVGVDIVFVIDNSGSMGDEWPSSDPQKKRFAAIKTLADAFAPTRDALDRIAIVTFQGSERYGDLAVEVDTPNSPWKTWSDTSARVQALPTSSPGGKTPIADAMRKANALLTQSDGFYRLAILISDGLPTPDDEDCPQTTDIVEDIIPNECVPNRILYSTIYLYTQAPEDNALLDVIAKETDYITPYLPGQPPEYYFRITSPNEIVAKYRALFDTLKGRLVPQDVKLLERVNTAQLEIDPGSAVTFSGSGFNEETNLLGGVPLDALIEDFRHNGRFGVRLNELAGEIVFRFSVKLDLGSVTDAEYSAGYVYVDVDMLPESILSWLEPNAAGGSTRRTVGLPQARIKFVLGLNVTKELDPNGSTVRVRVANIDFRPIGEFQLAEFPSSYATVSGAGDDFAFHPFRMLYEHRILPWFLRHVPVEGLSQQAAQTLLAKVREALRASHEPVFDREAVLDSLLCQFWFYERKPGSGVYEPYWHTPSQRGFYKADVELPPGTERILTFELGGASYLPAGGQDQMLSTPADALEPKGLFAMSEYTAQALGGWKTVLPNPDIFQIVSTAPSADLFLRTCFSADHVYQLLPLLLGRSVPGAWGMLDSADIGLIWRLNQGRRPRVGVAATIHNGGDAVSALTRVRAESLYLPFTGVELSQPANPRRPWQPPRPFFGSGEADLAAVQPHSSWPVEVLFSSLYYIGPGEPSEQVDPAFLPNVQDAIVITRVEVVPAANEKIAGNNAAVEIAALRGA